MLCSWSARSSKKRCRRSMVPMCSARRPIITTKNRNMAISCSRNCSAASRKFTSTSYGASEADLAQVAWKNYAHAKLNPLAQMRDADLTLDCASQVSDKNPSVAPPLKVSDCSQITDGAASVVLVSGKYLEKIGRDKNKTARLRWLRSHRPIICRSTRKMRLTFSTARKAAMKAFGMANLKPRDVQGAEVHDCFSITEIVAYEILGLAESGKGVELVKSGATALPQVRNQKSGKLPFEIPVNTGGGLIADGHPVGATGVRQVFDAYQQLTEQAGARQIENVKKFLTFNMGGSLTTSVAMVWGRDKRHGESSVHTGRGWSFWISGARSGRKARNGSSALWG